MRGVRLWKKRYLWSHLKLIWGAELESSWTEQRRRTQGPSWYARRPNNICHPDFFMRTKILKNALLSGVSEAEE